MTGQLIDKQETEEQRASLIRASKTGNVKEVKKLIDGGANPNVANWLGQTPLMYLANLGCTNAVKSLLEAGACPHHENINGDTALDQTTNPETIQELKQHIENTVQ